MYVLLLSGDFNARVVASSVSDDHLWRGIWGKYGVGVCNEARERFLEFCAVNYFTVMNTWFSKKPIHLATLRHPATKEMIMIDYVVMRSEQRMCCTDVRVMRGATCWTDHHMIRVKLRVAPLWRRRRVPTPPIAVHSLRSKDQQEQYQQILDEHLSAEPHNRENPTDHSWNVLKSCVIYAAEEVVGRGQGRQFEWFLDAADALRPLLEAKHAALNKVLQGNTTANRRAFMRQQRLVKGVVDKAKEEWMGKVADDTERAKRDGHLHWKCIRQLQMAHAGCKPKRLTMLMISN